MQTAAYEGRVEEVRSLLQDCKNPDEVSDNPATPLILASMNGYTQIVELLLRANANINYTFGFI